MKRRFLWITDPWETLDHPRDTTLRLIQESLEQGHESYWCDVSTIRLEGDSVRVTASRVRSMGRRRMANSIRMDRPKAMKTSAFHSLQYRTDPPIDLAYLHPLQLLALGAGKAEVVNPASVLFMANEKLEGAALSRLAPPSVASSKLETLRAFGRKQGRTVLKPLHQAQSKGVELLDWRTTQAARMSEQMLAQATQGFRMPILLQSYLEGIQNGETRLWFVDGKLLASVRKLPLQDDFRVNMDRGSRVVQHRLSVREKRASQAIGRHLKKRRIRLAAVDLIAGKVTDFNFTSPGLIVQMEEVTGKNLAAEIIRALARRFQ